MDFMWIPDIYEAPRSNVKESIANEVRDNDDVVAATTQIRAHRFTAAAKAGSKGCILVVDDDEAVRATLADILEIVGYLPIQAGDAVEALMILRRDPNIVALVTDLTMPGADGIALIRHARSIRSDLPAILLTGYAEQATAVSTIAGGNFHVLRKPVESERLIQQLDLLVAR